MPSITHTTEPSRHNLRIIRNTTTAPIAAGTAGYQNLSSVLAVDKTAAPSDADHTVAPRGHTAGEGDVGETIEETLGVCMAVCLVAAEHQLGVAHGDTKNSEDVEGPSSAERVSTVLKGGVADPAHPHVPLCMSACHWSCRDPVSAGCFA